MFGISQKAGSFGGGVMRHFLPPLCRGGHFTPVSGGPSRVFVYRYSSKAHSSTPDGRVRILHARSNNPFLNVAAEDWLFREVKPNEHTLFLWRNSPTVVIGRNQNPFKECNLQQMDRDDVSLVRRFSGGGAVYQNLGNTNFTFLSGRDAFHFSKEENMQLVAKALQKLGAPAMVKGRNDITVGDKKISGSAFRFSGPRAMHHGTVIVNMDFNFDSYLTPSKEKMKSKGVASVRARVTNLVDVVPDATHDMVCEALADAFSEHHHHTTPEVELLNVDEEMLNRVPSLNECYRRIEDWDWRFGECPDFTYNMETRFPWGTMDVHIDAADGLVSRVQLYSDCLYPNFIDAVQESLQGVKYDSEGVIGAVQEARSLLLSQNKGGDTVEGRKASAELEGFLTDFQTWILKEL